MVWRAGLGSGRVPHLSTLTIQLNRGCVQKAIPISISNWMACGVPLLLACLLAPVAARAEVGVFVRFQVPEPAGQVRPDVVAGSAISDRLLPAGSGRTAKPTRACNIRQNNTCLPPMKAYNVR